MKMQPESREFRCVKVNFLFTVLTACTVSIASRTVGTLIISSMLVVPVAFGMQMGNSYRMTVLWSVLAAVGTTILGLFILVLLGNKTGWYNCTSGSRVLCGSSWNQRKGDGTMTTPVYIVEGFLGSGKTKLIENSLRLRHCRNVLIFQFEEGEEVLDTKEAERCSWKIRSWDRDELETHLEEVADRVEVELEIHRYEEIWVEWNGMERFGTLEKLLLSNALRRRIHIERVMYLADVEMAGMMLGQTGEDPISQVASSDVDLLEKYGR